MLNIESLVKYAKVISIESFVADILIHYRAPLTGCVSDCYIDKDTILAVSLITAYYDELEEKPINADNLQTVYCTFVDKILEDRISKKYVSEDERMDKYYNGISLEIKGSELINKFKLISLPDFSNIDIDNKIHREHLVEEFLNSGELHYEFDNDTKIKMNEIMQEYAIGLITRNEAYNFFQSILGATVNDMIVEKNLDEKVHLNKN